jgi:hypothetical protein
MPAAIASCTARRQPADSLPPDGATPISIVRAPSAAASDTVPTMGTSRAVNGTTSLARRPEWRVSITATTSRVP